MTFAICKRTLRSLGLPADDERRSQQSACIGARAFARRELQHEQRGVDPRIVRHRHRSGEHNRDRQRAAQRLPRGRHEDIFEHPPHFFAARREIAQDHSHVLRTRQHLIARPLRGEVELGCGVVGSNDS